MKPSNTAPSHSSVLKEHTAFRFLLPAAFWLAVWWGIALWVDMELLVPTPLCVIKTLGALAVTVGFWQTAGISLLRIFCGTLSGILLGTALAVLTDRFRIADCILSPAIRIIRTVPVASFIILVLLWVKTGQVPGVISALIVLPILWENVTAGLKAVDPLLLEMCNAYRLGRLKKLRFLYLPALRPCFSSGVCSAIGLAWKSGVAAEVLCLPKQAIGTQVYFSKIYLETPALFAWTGVVILLSLLLETLVKKLLKGGIHA